MSNETENTFNCANNGSISNSTEKNGDETAWTDPASVATEQAREFLSEKCGKFQRRTTTYFFLLFALALSDDIQW